MSFSQEEKEYISILQDEIKDLEEKVKEVRAVKHDMYAHLLVLRHYIGSKQYDKAEGYLSKLMEIAIFHPQEAFDTGNDLVNLVFSKKIAASKKKIHIKTEGLLPEDLWLEEMDLCVLFSNLISNSVEACEKLVLLEPEITLNIEEGESELAIYMSNPIEEEVDADEFGMHTTKENQEIHGYGVLNIKKILAKYQGTIVFQCKDSLVLVKVTIPRVA